MAAKKSTLAGILPFERDLSPTRRDSIFGQASMRCSIIPVICLENFLPIDINMRLIETAIYFGRGNYTGKRDPSV